MTADLSFDVPSFINTSVVAERFPVGQNIHIASAIGQEPSNLEEMIQDWYDEVASFDKKIVSSFK